MRNHSLCSPLFWCSTCKWYTFIWIGATKVIVVCCSRNQVNSWIKFHSKRGTRNAWLTTEQQFNFSLFDQTKLHLIGHFPIIWRWNIQFQKLAKVLNHFQFLGVEECTLGTWRTLTSGRLEHSTHRQLETSLGRQCLTEYNSWSSYHLIIFMEFKLFL